jgi:hypothetical protein
MIEPWFLSREKSNGKALALRFVPTRVVVNPWLARTEFVEAVTGLLKPYDERGMCHSLVLPYCS